MLNFELGEGGSNVECGILNVELQGVSQGVLSLTKGDAHFIPGTFVLSDNRTLKNSTLHEPM